MKEGYRQRYETRVPAAPKFLSGATISERNATSSKRYRIIKKSDIQKLIQNDPQNRNLPLPRGYGNSSASATDATHDQ